MHFLELCVHLIDTVEIFNQLHDNGAIGEGEQLSALHGFKKRDSQCKATKTSGRPIRSCPDF